MSGPEIRIRQELDLSSFDAFLLSAEDHVIVNLGLALEACGALVAATAKQTTKFRDRDGRLRGSIRAGEPHYDVQGGLGIDILAGGGEVLYGPYIEFGTRTIAPRRFMSDAMEKHAKDVAVILALATEKAFEEARTA